ncbi:hypothetical protein C900_04211 [Fulvivirga imtechensis AK7]|uniref:Uncharacterized protein n=1 Tax=Fulvivirga imtechensis AK7 TaxID=1237149 RepID=L8K0A2_9BACT|nr:hypothetical protein C900_04211 [Fulvivirga imtechensis AK7]
MTRYDWFYFKFEFKKQKRAGCYFEYPFFLGNIDVLLVKK